MLWGDGARGARPGVVGLLAPPALSGRETEAESAPDRDDSEVPRPSTGRVPESDSDLARHGTLVITPPPREQPGGVPLQHGRGWYVYTAYVQCVGPRGQAALRLRYVQHAGGWYAQRYVQYGGPGTCHACTLHVNLGRDESRRLWSRAGE